MLLDTKKAVGTSVTKLYDTHNILIEPASATGNLEEDTTVFLV